MRFVRGLSADMDDLTREKGQREAALSSAICFSARKTAALSRHSLWRKRRAIDTLAQTLTYAIEQHYTQPANFFGVGGMKIFRDLIYVMRGMMRADHRFYKAHGQYDFPQKQKGRILLMYLVGWMMNSKKLSKKIGSRMIEGMLMPYQKVLQSVKPENPNIRNSAEKIISFGFLLFFP